MAEQVTRSLVSRDADQTAALGARLAGLLGPGDCLLLSGDIGAGKTHFARALIQARLAAADRMEDVPSPTFTLVQTYDDDTVEIWHADLYRLSDPDQVLELGLSDAFDSAITLVEWPDRLGSEVPHNALTIDFKTSATPGERQITLAGAAQHWDHRIDALLVDHGAAHVA
jgi:tRNA threonylcarbamoyladenosine biosynthesis protein TsaE